MRHVWSILLALVLAPTVWLLCGAADGADLIGRARTADGFHSLTGLALLLSAGSAYAIMVLLPISPAGPTLAGLGYLGLGLWALVDPTSYAGLWSSADLGRPGYGLALLLAVPLIGTAVLTGRWEQEAAPGPAPESEPAGVPSWPVPIRMPHLDRPAAPANRQPDEATMLFTTPAAEATTNLATVGEETTVIRPPDVAATDENTTVIRSPDTAATDENTTAIPSPDAADENTTVIPSPAEEATALIKSPAVDEGEATTVLPTGRDRDAEETVAEDEPTESATVEEPAESVTTEVAKEQSAESVITDLAEERPTESVTTEVAKELPAESVTTDLAEEPTGSLPGERSTADLARDPGPGEKTQVIARDPGETTRDIRGGEGIYPIPGETTKSIEPDQPGDEPDTDEPPTDEPPGDRTQAIKLPAVGLDPEPAPSIVEAERPDPGADPTTRIVPLTEQPAEPGQTTAARSMTVMSMERPPDESAPEAPAKTLPGPRRPSED